MVNRSRGGTAPQLRFVSAALLWAGGLGLMLLALSACSALPARAAPLPQAAEVRKAALPPGEDGRRWSYGGDTGPAYWYRLDPSYVIAREGRAQSPIDIVTADLAANDALDKPVIAYEKTIFEAKNTGYTIEVEPRAPGNAILLDRETYLLQQFHFHAPSEHRIDGKPFAMELQLVHSDGQGNLAILGLLIKAGAHNETLGELFTHLPREITVEGAARPWAELNLGELFAAAGGMYRYDGSLTVPPCTEGVKWSIAMGPIEMSDSQIKAFQDLYRGNNRPVQNRYGRRVYAVER